jgi:3-hydroxybutyryl-CoA dehydrogenase
MSERIAVVGAGQMGGGIAHVAALSGYPVTVIDVADAALEKGRSAIAANLERQVKKGTIEATARDTALGRITMSTSLDASADAAVIIEAATERTDLKFKIFEELDRIATPGAILATNTPYR